MADGYFVGVQELEAAVMESNKSMSAAAAKAAEAAVKQALQEQQGVSELPPSEAIAPGGYPAKGDALGAPRKTVHFSDAENAPADAPNRQQTASSSAAAESRGVPDGENARGSKAEGQAGFRGGDEGLAEPASQQTRPDTGQQERGNTARRNGSPVMSPFAAADDGASAGGQPPQEASSAASGAAARPAAVAKSPFASEYDSAPDQPTREASSAASRAAPRLASIFRSPFASEDDSAPDQTPQEASNTASSAASRQAVKVRSPFAAADGAEVQEKPDAAPAGFSPFAAAQQGSDVSAAAPAKASPSKGQPPVIRSAFEME